MRSRINSTGRTKITSRCVDISHNPDNTFVANIDLSDLDLPGAAEVVVEAYRQSSFERFPFGVVSAIAPAGPTRLDELSIGEVNFRIKVIEPGTGRLLAAGDRFGPKDEKTHRRQLLNVVTRDLGAEPWKVAPDASGRPQLVLNDRIPDAIARLKTDPVFRALVIPSALREVLLALWCVRADVENDDDDAWETDWLIFAQYLSGEEPPDWDEEGAAQIWVDTVCRAFSNRYGFAADLIKDAGNG